MDALWEQYRSVSPYNYCGNNPVMLRDPTGMGWFDDLVKGGKDIAHGVFDAVASDITGQDIRTGDQYSPMYRASKLGAHVADAVVGTNIAATGTGMEYIGIVAAPETEGASLAISGVGVGVTAGGLWLGGNGLHNAQTMLSEASQSGGGEKKEELKYAPSKKHDEGGWGTKMDLDDKTGQKVLDESSQLGKQRYGYQDGKVYEFQPDNVGGWHGYPIKAQELLSKKGGTAVIKQWVKDGKLSKADYNKLIK